MLATEKETEIPKGFCDLKNKLLAIFYKLWIFMHLWKTRRYAKMRENCV